MSEQDELVRVVREAGADLVGVADASSYFEEFTTAIVIAVSTRRVCGRGEKNLMVASNELLDFLGGVARQWLAAHGYGYTGALFSQEKNGDRVNAPSRELAVSAGLGVKGKNRLVITERFGPRVQITTVLTTMPLMRDSRKVDFHPCRACNVCIEICPTEVFSDSFEGEKCIQCYRCILQCPAGRDFCKAEECAAINKPIWEF
jgi:epoxyqueuosine reductase QueG